MSCFVDKTVKSVFQENIAKEGPALFGGMLSQCERFPEEFLTKAFKKLEFDKMLYNWGSYAITSLGMKLCYNFSCEKQLKLNKTICLGQNFFVTVGCVDQLEQPLNNCVIKSDYDSDDFQLGPGETKKAISGFEQLSFHVHSNIINSTSLKIYSNLLCIENAWNEIEVFLDVQPCPLGFYLKSMKCICDCVVKTF